MTKVIPTNVQILQNHRNIAYLTYSNMNTAIEIYDILTVNDPPFQDEKLHVEIINEAKSEPSRRLFFKLSDTSSIEQDVIDSIKHIASIKNCTLIRDKVTRHSKGYGFLEFDSIEDAQLVLHMSSNIKIGNNSIFFDFAKGDSITPQISTKTLTTEDLEIQNWSSMYSQSDGITGYSFDEKSKMYFNSKLQFFYHLESGFYFHGSLKYWMYFDPQTKQYIKYEQSQKDVVKPLVVQIMKRWKESLDKPKVIDPIKSEEKPKKITIEEERKMIEKSLENHVEKKRKDKRKQQNTNHKLLGLDKKSSKALLQGETIVLAKPVDQAIPESNIGAKMMKNLGWKSGESLGKDNTGIKEPIKVEIHQKGLGLGFQKGEKPIVGENKKSQMLKRVREQYESIK